MADTRMLLSESAVFIGLGANLGDCEGALRRALGAISRLTGTQVQRVSSLYRSAPVDAGGPDYLNAVAQLATALTPHALLRALQVIELAEGRERPYRNAPRTLDLDILLFGERTIHTPQLTVPHPRIAERAFVLVPLAELAPGLVPARSLEAVAHQALERIGSVQWAKEYVVPGDAAPQVGPANQ